jgi:RNA-directed DNA polymerase
MSIAQAPIRKFSTLLYTDEIWRRYVFSVEENFKLKTYPHFDPYFDFPKEKHKIFELVSTQDCTGVAKHSFLPLVKILLKTPRYRYQENESSYGLETKIRPISFASHFDTYIYKFYSFSINEKYQQYIHTQGFDLSVLAYRTDLYGKCNIQFAKEVFDIVSQYGPCTAIALDIKGYFDSIDHQILKEKWCKVLGTKELPIDQYKIYKSLTKYNYVNKNSILKHFQISLKKKKNKNEKWITLLDLVPDNLNGSSFKEKFDLLRKRKLIVTNKAIEEQDGSSHWKGIPQGTSMSALLSNIYLIDFDEYIHTLGQKSNFFYRRYCDDIMVICPTESANEIMNLLIEEINNKYRLVIQSNKTEVIDFRQNDKGNLRSFKRTYNEELKQFDSQLSDEKNFKNLQYLGFEFNGHKIYIRPSSLSRYFRKMKARVVKTIIMAYSSKSKSNKIFKQQLLHRYTHLGKRNFLSYALNASKNYYSNSEGEKKEGMNSPSIRRQVSSHISILQNEINKTSEQISKKVKSQNVKL